MKIKELMDFIKYLDIDSVITAIDQARNIEMYIKRLESLNLDKTYAVKQYRKLLEDEV